jgi:hypothetical protein
MFKRLYQKIMQLPLPKCLGKYALRKRFELKRENISAKGHLTIEERPRQSADPEDWETVVDEHNIVVDVGLEKVIDFVLEDHDDVIDYFALGTDGAGPNAGDTALGNQVHEELFDSSTKVDYQTARWEGLLTSVEPSGQPFDFAEFGTKWTDKTLFNHVTFASTTKDSTVEWRIRFELTLANA